MYWNFSLHDQDSHLAELWHEGFIKNYLRIAGVVLASQHF